MRWLGVSVVFALQLLVSVNSGRGDSRADFGVRPEPFPNSKSPNFVTQSTPSKLLKPSESLAEVAKTIRRALRSSSSRNSSNLPHGIANSTEKSLLQRLDEKLKAKPTAATEIDDKPLVESPPDLNAIISKEKAKEDDARDGDPAGIDNKRRLEFSPKLNTTISKGEATEGDLAEIGDKHRIESSPKLNATTIPKEKAKEDDARDGDPARASSKSVARNSFRNATRTDKKEGGSVESSRKMPPNLRVAKTLTENATETSERDDDAASKTRKDGDHPGKSSSKSTPSAKAASRGSANSTKVEASNTTVGRGQNSRRLSSISPPGSEGKSGQQSQPQVGLPGGDDTPEQASVNASGKPGGKPGDSAGDNATGEKQEVERNPSIGKIVDDPKNRGKEEKAPPREVREDTDGANEGTDGAKEGTNGAKEGADGAKEGADGKPGGEDKRSETKDENQGLKTGNEAKADVAVADNSESVDGTKTEDSKSKPGALDHVADDSGTQGGKDAPGKDPIRKSAPVNVDAQGPPKPPADSHEPAGNNPAPAPGKTPDHGKKAADGNNEPGVRQEKPAAVVKEDAGRGKAEGGNGGDSEARGEKESGPVQEKPKEDDKKAKRTETKDENQGPKTGNEAKADVAVADNSESVDGTKTEDSKSKPGALTISGREKTGGNDKKEAEKSPLAPSLANNEDGSSSSHFMTYFVSISIITIVAYVTYHNRKKILGLILEGRGGAARARRSRVGYSRLRVEPVADDVASGRTDPVRDFIY